MSPARPRARSLTVYLVKHNVTAHRDILPNVRGLTAYRVPIGEAFADLYVKHTAERTPSWISLFSEVIHIDENYVYNASSAAVFLVAAGNRIFAVTFGYGRSLL